MGTITKALNLLNLFSAARPSIGLGDFVRLSGRDKATVHRHLVELADNGFLEQDPQSRTYRLGPAVLRLSAVREATFPTSRIVRPLIEDLGNEVGELVHFSLLEGHVLTPVCHHEPGHHRIQVHFDEAERLPLHATSSGLAVLAFSDADFVQAVLAAPLPSFTDRTATTREALSRALEDTRRSGIARIDKAFDPEVSSCAAPVFDPFGTPTGSVAIATPASRTTAETARAHRAALAKMAPRITAALGGTLPGTFPS